MKFFGMIATSAVLMFMVMYLNTYEFSHVFFSETRLYMTILSTCVMALVMLGFMLHMLKNRLMNIIIVSVSVLVFITSFVFMRYQTTIDDVDYMEGMIPHHSIAILTSERAKISDPRVRELADEIIEAQKKEIAEMKKLIEDLEDEE
jgi:cell division protein FtsW (lipid II flippase)